MALQDFRAAIVDLDGTLVNTLGDFEVALNQTLAALDLPPVTRALVERTVGKGSEHLIRSVLAHQLALPEVAGLADVCDRAINGAHAQVYPGAAEGLQALQAAGLALACLTNKPLAFARELLAAKGLAGHFQCVFGGDSFARKKPDPLPLLNTCQALGVAPAQALMVGDSSNDAQAGHAAGCAVVLVTYGYNHGEPIQQTPALAWLDSLAQLPAVWAPKAL